MVKELVDKYLPTPYVEGTHFQTSFGHLDGYSAVYYTYMWSLVIAKDMFSQFDRRQSARARRLPRSTATRCSRPAARSRPPRWSRDFLGRPFEFKAWEQWLNRGIGRAGGMGRAASRAAIQA